MTAKLETFRAPRGKRFRVSRLYKGRSIAPSARGTVFRFPNRQRATFVTGNAERVQFAVRSSQFAVRSSVGCRGYELLGNIIGSARTHFPMIQNISPSNQNIATCSNSVASFTASSLGILTATLHSQCSPSGEHASTRVKLCPISLSCASSRLIRASFSSLGKFSPRGSNAVITPNGLPRPIERSAESSCAPSIARRSIVTFGSVPKCSTVSGYFGQSGSCWSGVDLMRQMSPPVQVVRYLTLRPT